MRSSVRRADRNQIRVFYIEDRKDDRDKMRELCQHAPDLIYVGEASKDSAALVGSIRQSRADVVIVDPVLNAFSMGEREKPTGLPAIGRIREQFGQSVKIVVLTNYEHLDAEALEAGADLVLHKGASTDDVRKAIRELAGTQARTGPPKYGNGAVDSNRGDGSFRPSPENPGEEPLTETQAGTDRRKGIRIFHLEDDEVERAGIQQMCLLTPEGDLLYIGNEAANIPDLADRIAKSRADVAIIDLALKRYAKPNIEQILDTPLTSGLLAVAALHKRFGRQLKIMVLTNYPEYTSRALAAGADTVVDKGISFDELRQAIRDLAAGQTPAPFGIGDPVALDIFIEVDQRRFVVTGERGKTPELRLEPLPMTFLVYLAEERKAQGTNYVKRIHQGMVPAHPNTWESIVKRVGSDRGLDARGVLLDPARWAAVVNKALRPFLAQSPKSLVIGPQKRGAHATYSLSADITQVRIVWPNQ